MGSIGTQGRAWCRRELAPHRVLIWVLGTAALYGCMLAAVNMHDRTGLTAIGVAIAAVAYVAFAVNGIVRGPGLLLAGVGAVGALVCMAAGVSDELLGPVIVIGQLLFSVHGERRTVIRGTVAVLGVLLTGHLLLIGLHGRGGLPSLDVLLWVALAAALGQAVRSKRQHEAMLQERARRAEEGRDEEARRRVQDERLRIARDLHDAVGHHVALISVQAGAMGYLLDSDLDKARVSLAHIHQASEAALEELRLTVGLLRQPGEAEPVEPLGGLARLDDLIGSFTATGLRVTQSSAGQVRPLPEALDLTAYRVIQESLTNTAKHAPGAAASILLLFSASTLTLTIEDNGPQSSHEHEGPGGHGVTGSPPIRGAVTAGVVPPGEIEVGHGIIGMRERAAALGGWLSAGRRTDASGFRVTAMLPIPAGRAAGSCR